MFIRNNHHLTRLKYFYQARAFFSIPNNSAINSAISNSGYLLGEDHRSQIELKIILDSEDHRTSSNDLKQPLFRECPNSIILVKIAMPKTRRAGRKNQVRRLYRNYEYAPADSYRSIVDPEYYRDPEYERLFVNTARITCVTPWPEQLTPIDTDVQPYRPATIHPGDPRGAPRSPIKQSFDQSSGPRGE